MQHFKLVLRIGKPLQPALADRIENDNARAAFSRTAQIAQHARMIGARILTDDENGVSHFEIFQKHRALADTDRLLQRDTACLVAHIGAVGEVIGAVGAHEQLIEERSLVGSAAGRIELDAVRTVEALENIADGLESLVPFDGFILIGRSVVTHRMGQATGIFQIVIRPATKLGNRMFAEKGRRRAPVGCLPGDSLHAVLAKLKRRAMFRITPGATGAIEPVRLVCLEKRARAGEWSAAGEQLLAAAFQCTPSTRSSGSLADETGFGGLAHPLPSNPIAGSVAGTPSLIGRKLPWACGITIRGISRSFN